MPRPRKQPDNAPPAEPEQVAKPAEKPPELPGIEDSADVPIASDAPEETPEPKARPSKAGYTPPAIKAPARRTAAAYVEGRKPKDSTQADDRIRLRASEYPNFILTHDPNGWGYYPEAKRILPHFGSIKLSPGIGRVDSKGRADGALIDAAKAGRTVIFDRDVEGGYLREYDMLGGVGFLASWIRIKVSGRIASPVMDHVAYAAFVDTLIRTGKLLPPSEPAIAFLRDQAVNMNRLSEPRRDRPSVQKEIAINDAIIEACDALLEGEA